MLTHKCKIGEDLQILSGSLKMKIFIDPNDWEFTIAKCDFPQLHENGKSLTVGFSCQTSWKEEIFSLLMSYFILANAPR